MSKSKCERQVSAIAGYLLKMKKVPKVLGNQWTKRWFTIEGTQMKWYKDARAEEPSGVVQLDSITNVAEFEMNSFVVSNFYP